MEQPLSLLLLLAAGYLLRFLPVFPAETDRSLNLYVIYIALPALILRQVPGLHFSRAMLTPVLMPWLVVLCSGLLVLLLCRAMRWPRETTGALLLVVPLGNTSFLGIPMVEQFFGSSAVSWAILYDQFGSFLALSTYGTLILAIYGGSTITPAGILRRVLLFPPFIALLAATFLPIQTYLQPLDRVLALAAGSLVPVVLVAIGFQMRLLLPGADLMPFAAGLLIRLLLIPILFLALCRLLGLEGIPVQVSLFETAMPPMVTAGALASIAGLKPRLTSAMVGLGILFSFLTLPLVHRLIQIYL